MAYFNKERLEAELKELEAITMKLESHSGLGDLTPGEMCRLRAFINNRKVEIRRTLDTDDKNPKGRYY